MSDQSNLINEKGVICSLNQRIDVEKAVREMIERYNQPEGYIMIIQVYQKAHLYHSCWKNIYWKIEDIMLITNVISHYEENAYFSQGISIWVLLNMLTYGKQGQPAHLSKGSSTEQYQYDYFATEQVALVQLVGALFHIVMNYPIYQYAILVLRQLLDPSSYGIAPLLVLETGKNLIIV